MENVPQDDPGFTRPLVDAQSALQRLVMAAPNEPVSLREGQFKIARGDNEHDGHGVVRLEWLPHPEIHLRMEYTTREFGETDPDEAIATLPEGEAVLPLGFVRVGARMDGDGLFTKPVSAYVHPLSLGDGPVNSVHFGIVNMPSFIWTRDVPDHVEQGELSLESDEWLVAIKPVGDSDFFSHLRDTNGYAITHNGSIRCKRGTFSSLEAANQLRALHYFFSFARGCWCPPVLAFGLDDKGHVTWEDWRVWNLDNASWRTTWLDTAYPQGLHLLYPGFLKLWESVRQPTLTRLIHMYVEANAHTSVDTGIVLSVVALQLMMWTVSRDRKGRRTKEVSELLKWMDIPNEVPPATPELLSYAHSLFPLEPERRRGSAMLEEVRNGIVHPTRRRQTPLDAVMDARFLGLHWFELAMLKMMGYQGSFVDRLQRHHVFGDHIRVPWASGD